MSGGANGAAIAAAPVLVRERDGILYAQLNRPERGNSLTVEAVDELARIVSTLPANGSVHTLVLHGAGRHFCTGFDLSGLESETEATLLHRFVKLELLLAAIWHSPVRTIALAQGKTWGAGADIFVACDGRLCTADATFQFPGPAFGVVLGTRRLLHRVGRDACRRLTIGNAVMGAAQARDAGLCSEIVESASPDDLPRVAGEPVDRATAAALREITCTDHRDADLAALVRSVTGGSLKGRIVAYRDAQLRAARRAQN